LYDDRNPNTTNLPYAWQIISSRAKVAGIYPLQCNHLFLYFSYACVWGHHLSVLANIFKCIDTPFYHTNSARIIAISYDKVQSAMNSSDLSQKIANLKVWKSNGQRAPHKPLLLLLALSRIQQNKPRMMLFAEIEKKLTELLTEFGPQRKIYYPEEPFCRLRTEGFWELSSPENIILPKGSFSKTTLRQKNISAGFMEDTYQLLANNSKLLENTAKTLLQDNFPSTIHQDILDSIGLDIDSSIQIEVAQSQKRIRNPKFRGKVLQAYNYRCAICGFDVRMGHTPIALEAAHIKWFQAGGEDTESNGLALCSLHHKLLDRGALAISNELTIIISEKANGYIGFKEWLLDFEGKALRMPQKEEFMPDARFTEWHVREVFQGTYT